MDIYKILIETLLGLLQTLNPSSISTYNVLVFWENSFKISYQSFVQIFLLSKILNTDIWYPETPIP